MKDEPQTAEGQAMPMTSINPNRLKIYFNDGAEIELSSEFESLAELITKARKIRKDLLINDADKSKPGYTQ